MAVSGLRQITLATSPKSAGRKFSSGADAELPSISVERASNARNPWAMTHALQHYAHRIFSNHHPHAWPPRTDETQTAGRLPGQRRHRTLTHALVPPRPTPPNRG